MSEANGKVQLEKSGLETGVKLRCQGVMSLSILERANQRKKSAKKGGHGQYYEMPLEVPTKTQTRVTDGFGKLEVISRSYQE